MPLVLDATVGGANSNSYLTVADAQNYFDARLPVAGWDDADSKEVLLVMATRTLNAIMQAAKTIVYPFNNGTAYYRVYRTWTGSPASTTQRLAWPRTGMFDRNGNAIPSNVIPQDLKDAVAELAGQLGNSDRTLDNDVSVQGLKSVSAGSVSLSFKDYIERKVLPDAVLDLLVPSWYTDEVLIPVIQAQFDVIDSITT